MIKETIKYTDYNGNELEEDFYFNLSKSEITEMELSYPNGLSDHITKITQSNNGAEIIKLFKELILSSYGRKSDDGKRFIKSDEEAKAFSQTEAYSELFMKLATNAEAAAEFVNGIVPKQLESTQK